MIVMKLFQESSLITVICDYQIVGKTTSIIMSLSIIGLII